VGDLTARRQETDVRRIGAILGSAAFFVLGPGLVAGWLPWRLTAWRVGAIPHYAVPVRVLGTAVAGAGVAVLVHAFSRFVREGAGTPAPVAPPNRLVVGGLYRYVRNPMYVAVLAIILGQAIALPSLLLVVYAGIVSAAVATFVLGYEEPHLTRLFGADYEPYLRAVPRWWPRRRPWHSGASQREVSPATGRASRCRVGRLTGSRPSRRRFG
jgi:protein-S-isoprenylcysteine O-methyltransferase Ste14